ncbi:class F sortase [Alkalicoccus urumqiensis]|uniref:class F sortase n=1 Tax=Alkalicoccus urumqiensis TaxID=1548213 RepID=UPI0015E5D197|nr:class F sortase [Alkalicoccus urumqiensis]
MEETALETEVESTENSTEPEAAAQTETEAETTPVTQAEPIEPVLGGSAGGIIPVTLSIPAIDVEGPVLPVGLEEDGAMEVPETGDDIGWFERGVKPGAQGNAVLAGHVDDLTGPAIFFDLEKLEAGDEITVTSADGESLTFVVTHKEAYPYQDAPIDEVFGATSSRRLNLITCTGEFDRDAGTHRERLVVFTELKQE